jgi:hypothetical protein
MLHRRQFLLAPVPRQPAPGWATRQLPAGTLSYHLDLPVQTVRDAAGADWCLLGLAVQTDPERDDPIREIARARTEAVPPLSRSWAGRWLLVGEGTVVPDAAALLSCFYRRDGTGGCWISSSPQVLFEVARLDASEIDPRTLTFNTGVTWYPPPASRFSSVRRLLPSQVLDIRSGAAASWDFLPSIEPARPYAETLVRLAERLVTPLARLPGPDGRLWLSLTAGIDSRLILAIASHLGLRFDTFTHEPPGLSIGDRFVPPLLARGTGASHRLIRGGAPSIEAQSRYDFHAAGHSVDLDREYYARGQWDFVRAGDILLHGGCFETGRCFYYDRFPEGGDCRLVPSGEVLASGLGEPTASTAAAGLEEWAEICRQTPVPWLDWRDRLYIEQRIAGWLSSLEQSLDLFPGTRFHPANAAETYALLLSLPAERRAAAHHQRDLVAGLAPHLTDMPVNPSEEEFGRFAQAWHRSRATPHAFLKRVFQRLASSS